jgi:large subunit ribosomal protein L23
MIFLKKRKEKKKEISLDKEKPRPKEFDKLKTQKIVSKETEKAKEKKEGQAWMILREPHITEKATDLVKLNQYVFKVWPKANKVEIKKAIESLYGVDVVGVKIVKVPPKRRRLGRIRGWRKGWEKGYKKAIVRIKEGQKIEVLPK